MTHKQRLVDSQRIAPTFRWWPAAGFFVSMYLLLGVWLFGRPEKPIWSSMVSSLFLFLAAALILFISWVLGSFRLPRRILTPMVVLTGGIVLALIQQGFFPATPEANSLWRNALQILVAFGFVWIVVANIELIIRRFKFQQHLANQDNLTGLLNRTGMQRTLQQLTPQKQAVLLMMDLNDLKSINDLNGHNAGDQHIQAVAQAIAETLPEEAAASRWGGDEFLVILPYSSLGQANRAAQAAIDHAPKIRLTLPALAFGAAEVHSYEDLERAIAVADQRMYENKELTKSNHPDTTSQYVPSTEEFMRLVEGLNSAHKLLRYGLENLQLILGFNSSSYYELLGTSLHASYISSTNAQQEAPLHNLKRDVSSGLLGQVMLTNSTIGTADYSSAPQAMPEWVAAGLRSLLATPVRDAGTIVGILVLTSYHNWRPITPPARRLLEAVALRLG